MSDDKRVSDCIDDLQGRGLYGFEASSLLRSLSASPAAVTKALNRLTAKGRVKRIRKDFYVIIPVEFASQGMIPMDWFIDGLMTSLGLPYYIGLQSAAALHGAAHQQIQRIQIVTPRQERPLERPGLSIRFFRKKDFTDTPLQFHKGHSGMLPVSTPAATAFDLLRYSRHIGGMDAVATILAELADSITPEQLAAAASAESSTAQIQRLGWLLDHLGFTPLADVLYRNLPVGDPLPRTPLDPGEPRIGQTSGNRWKIIENSLPETDL